MENIMQDEKEKIVHENNGWRLPKQIAVPKEVSEFLLKTLKGYKEEITKKFTSQLVNNEMQKDEFVINGEFIDIDGAIHMFLKPKKHSRMRSGGSIR